MSSPEPHPRRYQRVCRSCSRLDTTSEAIAGSHTDGEQALRAESWSCPHCGGSAFDVVTSYRDGDLDGVPVPIVALRAVRDVRRGPSADA